MPTGEAACLDTLAEVDALAEWTCGGKHGGCGGR